MEKVVKTWREMKTDELVKDKERVLKFREIKRGKNAAQTSSLTMLTDQNKGHESRCLVEEMQFEKRLHRIPMYAEAKDTWSPDPVRKATRKDCLKLIKSINSRDEDYAKQRIKNMKKVSI